MITDPLFYLLAIPAVTALGLGKGGFIGIGMIAAPLLALVVPPLQGAAILLPILICQDIISIWTYRHTWSAWNLKVLLPGAVLGTSVAAAFASSVSNAGIEVTIGALGLSFAVYFWLGPRLLPRLRRAADETHRPPVALGILWGAMSGFMSLLIQVGAPPFQIHILPQRLDKLTLVGTSVIFFAFVNWMKIVPYFALGQFSTRNFATSVALLPLAVAANFLGIWLVRKTPQDRFYQLSYLLMVLISLALLWQGWRGLGR
ncbi:MAG TPA: sulfite exporter TauE/SafE family protein [Xanthobacteraceae bacterium]|nr:sulfite exporter TauE/SafE family protein [Xanthobacteraceae bacterium]